MKRSLNFFLLVAVCCLISGTFAWAQQKKNERSSIGMTKAREAAALAFVREHHPELESLLIQLKESRAKQYESAIRDLFRTSERLTVFLEKDPVRHELELKAWQAKSRVQLLSATLMMTPQDARTRGRLKQALLDESQVRRELLELEHQRTTKRLERLNSQIRSLENSAEQSAERKIKLLLEGQKSTKPAKTKTPRVN